MTSFDSVNQNSSVLDQYSIRNQEKEAEKSDKNMFLELMIAQMKNQNPLKPKEGGEFLAQLAQFSTVEGIDKLNSTMSDVSSNFQSSQALQATALVGRSVQVQSDSGDLGVNSPLQGSVEVPQSVTDLRLGIYSPSGALMNSVDVGPVSGGDFPVKWDGVLPDGSQAPPGEYRIKATATVNGEQTNLNTFMNANVDSVTLGKGGQVTLNVANVGPVALSSVKEIR